MEFDISSYIRKFSESIHYAQYKNKKCLVYVYDVGSGEIGNQAKAIILGNPNPERITISTESCPVETNFESLYDLIPCGVYAHPELRNFLVISRKLRKGFKVGISKECHYCRLMADSPQPMSDGRLYTISPLYFTPKYTPLNTLRVGYGALNSNLYVQREMIFYKTGVPIGNIKKGTVLLYNNLYKNALPPELQCKIVC